MPTLARVLVALDGSPSADGAFAFALELARQYGSELILCTAVDREAAVAALSAPDGPVFGVETIFDTIDTAAQSLLQSLSVRATAAGARFTIKLLDGRTAVALTDYAHDAGVDAIVMGTHGRHGLDRMLLGSIADDVLRLTAVPVFVVHLAGDDVPAAAPQAVDVTASGPRAVERILVAIDDSDPSDAALLFALDLAASAPCLVFCCTVVETAELRDRAKAYGYDPAPYLDPMKAAADALIDSKAKLAAQRGLIVEGVVVEGHPPEAIVAAAAARAADLVVMGTHGRRGLRRLFVGSVAEQVIRSSPAPVAVVRAVPPAASA